MEDNLKKITIQDIAPIIRESLDKKDEVSFYSFKSYGDYVLFGKSKAGLITDPYKLIYDEEDNLCEKIYDMIQNEFPNVFKDGYSHDFTGEYDFFVTSDKLLIDFPNTCREDQEWIFNKIHPEQKGPIKTYKMQ